MQQSLPDTFDRDLNRPTQPPRPRLLDPLRQAFGKKPQGVLYLYGQETKTPHLMRIRLIIVRLHFDC